MYHGGGHAIVHPLLFASSGATAELNMNNPGTLFVKSYIYLII